MASPFREALAAAYHVDQAEGNRTSAVAGLRAWLQENADTRDEVVEHLGKLRLFMTSARARRADHITAVTRDLLIAALV